MLRSDRSARSFDVVLFGATGFTGRLVAEYVAKHYARDLVWAIAGRNRAKLEAVRMDLARIEPGLASLEILVADSADLGSLEAVARSTRVVCTTVGPYATHGGPLVNACAMHGTDYCDLTGEVPFIRRSIDENHARAEATQARIVHSTGFDSIPSDLGVWMLHEHLREHHGRSLARASFFCGPTKGGMSGGTIASMMELMDAAGRDRELRRLVADPYALLPDRTKDRGGEGRDRPRVHFDKELGEWTAPFVMSAINTRVVRRSNALLGFPYGRDFRYEETMSLGRGPAGFARAAGLTAGLGAFVAAAASGPGRSVLKRALPAPGEGPSKEQRETGFFKIRLLGESDPGPDGRTVRVEGWVEGTSDPGYGETAKMITEAAVCLAKDETKLPARFGVLTPASAMGSVLIERLRAAGMVFRVADRA